MPPVEVVSALIVDQLRWRWAGGPPVTFAAVSLKAGSAMKLDTVLAAFQAADVRFRQEALGITDPHVPLSEGQLCRLHCIFARLWSLMRWENEHEERLAVDDG